MRTLKGVCRMSLPVVSPRAPRRGYYPLILIEPLSGALPDCAGACVLEQLDSGLHSMMSGKAQNRDQKMSRACLGKNVLSMM